MHSNDANGKAMVALQHITKIMSASDVNIIHNLGFFRGRGGFWGDGLTDTCAYEGSKTYVKKRLVHGTEKRVRWKENGRM